jgi:hypothetical protein
MAAHASLEAGALYVLYCRYLTTSVVRRVQGRAMLFREAPVQRIERVLDQRMDVLPFLLDDDGPFLYAHRDMDLELSVAVVGASDDDDPDAPHGMRMVLLDMIELGVYKRQSLGIDGDAASLDLNSLGYHGNSSCRLE